MPKGIGYGNGNGKKKKKIKTGPTSVNPDTIRVNKTDEEINRQFRGGVNEGSRLRTTKQESARRRKGMRTALQGMAKMGWVKKNGKWVNIKKDSLSHNGFSAENNKKVSKPEFKPKFQ